MGAREGGAELVVAPGLALCAVSKSAVDGVADVGDARRGGGEAAGRWMPCEPESSSIPISEAIRSSWQRRRPARPLPSGAMVSIRCWIRLVTSVVPRRWARTACRPGRCWSRTQGLRREEREGIQDARVGQSEVDGRGGANGAGRRGMEIAGRPHARSSSCRASESSHSTQWRSAPRTRFSRP